MCRKIDYKKIGQTTPNHPYPRQNLRFGVKDHFVGAKMARKFLLGSFKELQSDIRN